MAKACSCRDGGLWFEFRPRRTQKTFEDVGNLLTKSVSPTLSKYSGSIHLIHTIQNQKQHNNIPYKRLTLLELDLGPFPPDVAYFLPNDQLCHLFYV